MKAGPLSAAIAIAITLSIACGAATARAAGRPEIVMAKNGSAGYLTKAAVDGIGGMIRFVKPGQSVIIKVDVGLPKRPGLGLTTNPDVVSELVDLCMDAGASDVAVFDNPEHDPRVCFSVSGMQSAAELAGARVLAPTLRSEFWSRGISGGKELKNADISSDILACDVLINVPAIKENPVTGVSLGIKNMLNVVWQYPKLVRGDLDQSMADILTTVRPNLIVLDGTNLRATGEGRTGCVIAAVDPVAADSFGAELLGLGSEHIGHIVKAYESGLGSIARQNDARTISVNHWGKPAERRTSIESAMPVLRIAGRVLIILATVLLYGYYFYLRSAMKRRAREPFRV